MGAAQSRAAGERLQAVVAEKPSVARDIARVLGAREAGEGYYRGSGWVVTWAIGHLVGLAQPHEVRPEWRRWERSHLPMLPQQWPLVVARETASQFQVVRRILNSPQVEAVVCATDAGREGELIFRYIYEAAGCRKPVRRLWVSSLTEGALREGLRGLRPGAAYDALADAARGRSRADWLVGMNLSRLYTLASGETLSVGRVQTPTLAMVAERELAIRHFVPQDYLEVVATFAPAGPRSPQGPPGRYTGVWFRSKGPRQPEPVGPLAEARRLPADGAEAAQVVARTRAGRAAVESATSETRRMPPPLLYDLTELQRHANRLWGWSAQKTLEVAQALYERHKLLSYPRTSSRHLSQQVAHTLPEVVRAIRQPFEPLLAPGTGQRPLGRRFVDDGKVTDHHALIPTPTSPEGARLSADERRLYELVCRRLLAAWHEDCVWSVTTVITAVTSPGASGAPAVVDRFHSSGSVLERPGWKVLDLGGGTKPPRARGADKAAQGGAESGAEGGAEDSEPEQALPPGLVAGLPRAVEEAQAVKKQTRPPPRFTEASLLTAMESAGRTLEDRELAEAMRESGLGTPATRASIIETLLERGYLRRQGRSLVATEKGLGLVQVVHPQVKSPAMTGQWEAWLQRIERGSGELEDFLRGIESYVSQVVAQVPATGLGAALRAAASAAQGPGAAPRGGGEDLEEPSSEEAQALARILGALHARDGQALGRLHREVFGESLPRRDYERLVAGLERAGLVRLSDETFEKEGRRIDYKRVSLTPEGRRVRTPAAGQVKLAPSEESARPARSRWGRGKGRRPASKVASRTPRSNRRTASQTTSTPRKRTGRRKPQR